jgi:hypothetical protein
MQEIVPSNVINRSICAIVELGAIIKIHKYKGFHEGHHFILTAMEVHGALGRNMDHFIMERAHFSHDKHSGVHLSLFFCIQFFRQCVSIIL